MTTAALIALTNAVKGKDEEFNNWYDNVHLTDVIACPGVTAAQRFDALDFEGNKGVHQHVAIYDIEDDNPVAVVEEIFRRFSSGEMVQSDALADDFVAILYTARGAKRFA